MATRAKKKASSSGERRRPPRYFIVKLETFEGRDTACYVLGTDPMWVVASVSEARGAAIVDWGYRSVEEAKKAWPDAIAPAGEPRTTRAPVGVNRVPGVFSEPWFQGVWRRNQGLR